MRKFKVTVKPQGETKAERWWLLESGPYDSMGFAEQSEAREAQFIIRNAYKMGVLDGKRKPRPKEAADGKA